MISLFQTHYENGDLVLTSHRLLWTNPSLDASRGLALPLSAVVMIEEEQGGFMKSAKVEMQLGQPTPG